MIIGAEQYLIPCFCLKESIMYSICMLVEPTVVRAFGSKEPVIVRLSVISQMGQIQILSLRQRVMGLRNMLGSQFISKRKIIKIQDGVNLR
jgi:hypothetical protein